MQPQLLLRGHDRNASAKFPFKDYHHCPYSSLLLINFAPLPHQCDEVYFTIKFSSLNYHNRRLDFLQLLMIIIDFLIGFIDWLNNCWSYSPNSPATIIIWYFSREPNHRNRNRRPYNLSVRSKWNNDFHVNFNVY